MHRFGHFLFLCAIFLILAVTVAGPSAAPAAIAEAIPQIRTQTITLGPVRVNKVYPIMVGPSVGEAAHVGDEELGDDIWVIGYRVDVMDSKGAPQTLAHLCHAWAYDVDRPKMGLMTVSQGMAEMDLPKGYAIRLENKLGNVMLSAQTMNDDPAVDKTLSFKMTFRYVESPEGVRMGLKPLRQVAVWVKPDDVSPEHFSKDDALFYVPPGFHEYHSQIRDPLFYTGGTIHMIKLHLHAYGESVALFDKTTGKVVWKGYGKTDPDRHIVVKTDSYSSSEGIKTDKTHDYELIATYNNTTATPVDAMALLRLYVASDEQ